MKLKKIIAFILVLSLMFSVTILSPVFAESKTLISENFNSTEIGSIPSKFKKAGVNDGKSTVAVSENPTAAADKALKVYDNDTAAAASAYVEFEPQSAPFSVKFDYYFVKGSGQPTNIVVADGTAWPPAITFMATANITVFDGGATKVIKTNTALDAWHRAIFVLYPETREFDVYLDNEKITPSKLKFRNGELTKLSRLTLGAGTSGAESTIYYDNVEVFTGLPDIKEDPNKPVITSAPTATPTALYQDEPKDAVKIMPSLTDMDKQMYAKAADSVVLALGKNTGLVKNMKVFIDPVNPKTVPFTMNDRTLVPARFIAEGFGAKVDWDDANSTAIIAIGGNTVKMKEGSSLININGTDKEIDVSVQIIEGRTFIPLRAMAEAVGKNVFWDDCGLIFISPGTDVLENTRDRELIDNLYDLLSAQKEENSFAPYSSVFMSTRWFRQPGTLNPWTNKPDATSPNEGTLDIMKQMMVTHDLWTYLNTPNATTENFLSMANGGVMVQAAVGGMLESEAGAEGKATRDFDGKYINAPWVTTGSRPEGDAASPEMFESILGDAKKAIDMGIFSIQHDDWNLNVAAYGWGGGFSKYNLDAFREYLKKNYSKEQLAQFGVTDIDKFDYKEYLKEKAGVTSARDYLSKKAKSPLDPIFYKHNVEITRDYHKRLTKAMDDYAGRHVLFSANVAVLSGINTEGNLINDIIDFPQGEAPEGSYSFKNILTFGSALGSMGKNTVISPIPKDVKNVLIGAASAYATGQYMMFPWDTYVDWESPRYFGSPSEYRDVYNFIRRYNYLFDSYEQPAKVGLLILRDKMDRQSVITASAKLAEAGVPFKDLIYAEKDPPMQINSEKLKGLDTIVAYNEVSEFPKEIQDLILGSGINVVKLADLDGILQNKSVLSFSEDRVNGIIRTNVSSPLAPTVVHVLNQITNPRPALTLTVNKNSLKDFSRAVYYRPGQDPTAVSIKDEGDKISVSLPATDIWGIVAFGNDAGNFKLPECYSGLNIGNPIKQGFGAYHNETLELSSKGIGLNVSVPGDPGSSDQISYAYRNIVGSASETSVIAKIENADFAAGVMDRVSTASNSRFIAAVYENQKLKLVWRQANDLHTSSMDLGQITLPFYVKLTKKGDTYSVYAGGDKDNLGAAKASKAFPMDSRISGMFVNSSDNKTLSKAMFTDFGIVKGENLDISELMINDIQNLNINKKAKITAKAKLKSGGEVDLQAGDLTFTDYDTSKLYIDNEGFAFGIIEGSVPVTATAGNGAYKKFIINVTKPDAKIYYQDFESLTPGGSFPPEWTVNNAGIKIKKENSNILEVSADSEGASSDAKISFPPIKEKIVVEFDYKATFGSVMNDGGGRVAYIGSNLMAVCLISTRKSFQYFYGAEAKDIAPLTEGQWYKFKIIVDTPNLVADVYIDDKLVVDKGAFRNVADQVAGIWLGGFRVNPDTFHSWDNIKIYYAD